MIVRLIADLKRSSAEASHVDGVLFGTRADGIVNVEACRSFLADRDAGLDQRNWTRFDFGFGHLLRGANAETGMSGLVPLGWYSLRRSGGLTEVDVAFHNRFFRRMSDIALIVRHDEKGQFLLEIYTRSSTARLSNENYRWGSIRLPGDAQVPGPLELAIRPRRHDNLDWQPREANTSLDRAEKSEYWREAFRDAKGRILSFLRNGAGRDATTPVTQARPQSPAVSLRRIAQTDSGSRAVRTLTPEPQRNSGKLTPTHEIAGDPSSSAPTFRPRHRALLWISSLVVFVIFVGATFAFLLGTSTGQGPGFLKTLFDQRGLNLKVQGQGDRLLVTWNRRDGAVQSAREGLLRIQDGSESRLLRLNPSQLASASVLYKPHSADVSFQLEIRDGQGHDMSESTRVLDGSGPNPAADVTPAQPTPSSATLLDVPIPSGSESHSARAERNTSSDEREGTSATRHPSLPLGARRNHLGDQGTDSAAFEPGTRSEGTAPSTPSPAAPANVGIAMEPGFSPPRPVHQAVPNTRLLSPATVRSTPQVKVVVKVGETGRVTGAQIANAGNVNGIAATAALDAAREWEFQPATLHGKPVASEHTITFQFRSETR